MWAEKPRGEKGKKNKGKKEKKSKKQLNMIYTKYYAGKTKRGNRGLDYRSHHWTIRLLCGLKQQKGSGRKKT